MLMLIKAIGVFIVLAGIILFIVPNLAKKVMVFFKQGRRVYLAGFIRVLFGIIFLMGASECRLVGVIIVLGILLLVAGLSLFVIKLDKLKSIISFWENKSLPVIRLAMLIPIAIGALILYSA